MPNNLFHPFSSSPSPEIRRRAAFIKQNAYTLREINEDDHDLRSGRFFPEFEYPGDQIEEAMVNMTNWDTFLFSREFRAINDERSLRQATRLLTYPVTIGSVLHELSPYSIKKEGRLTVEGLKSLSGMF
jgi:splicing suppressor protein 51